MVHRELTNEYNNMYASISHILSNCLVSDPNKEWIDMDETEEKTKEFFSFAKGEKETINILHGHRKIVMNWLNNVYWDRKSISDDWLWENDYRIRKLIACMIILERLNLMSFKDFIGMPKPEDCPQSLCGLTILLDDKKTTFQTLKKDYKRKMEHNNLRYYYIDSPNKKIKK